MRADDNFWMKAGRIEFRTRRAVQRIPRNRNPGKLRRFPFAKMPVRSFLISRMVPRRFLPVFRLRLRGIAFSGYGGIRKVEVSHDEGSELDRGQLGRTRERIPSGPGRSHGLPSRRRYRWRFARRTRSGNAQPDEELESRRILVEQDRTPGNRCVLRQPRTLGIRRPSALSILASRVF